MSGAATAGTGSLRAQQIIEVGRVLYSEGSTTLSLSLQSLEDGEETDEPPPCDVPR